MKKNLFFKFFVLAAMVLFTITACQNDDVNVLQTDNDEVALQEAIRQLDAMNVELKDIIAARIQWANEEFTVLKQRFEANPGDEALQTQIIATAVHIEALTEFQTRAVGTYPTISTWSTGGGGMSHDVKRRELHEKLNIIVSYLAQLKIYIEANIGGSTTDLGPLTQRVAALETSVNSLNALIPTLATKTELSTAVTTLNSTISNLQGIVNTRIALLNSLLGIAGDPPVSSVLDGINAELTRLDNVKANKFSIEQTVYDLKDVYDELIAITDALDDRLTIAEEEIDDLQERVAYIEEVEIPAIWDGISFLYAYIGDVYNNFDQRVTGLTFKPEFDFGPGLSSLILVRGISEWEAAAVEGGFSWEQKDPGSVYRGVTWLTYNVSPANAKIDFETLDLVYTTTTMITRSSSEPLLEIMRVPGDNNYQISYENGILRVPVRIHQDLYPLVQTSFDANATENIKVALKLKNEGYTAAEEPTRPEKEPVVSSANGNGDNGDEDDRSVVSSEYVTVWLGLFDGRIAEQKSYNPATPVLYPTGIVNANFLEKDCSNAEYPAITLWVGDGKANSVTVEDSVLTVFYNEFEKKYSLPAAYNFTDHTLSYELVDLGNSANGLVTFTGSNGKIDVSTDNRAAATGKTLAVLVKAKVGDAVHALGYVRVIIAGPTKELIAISPDLSLTSPVTINCSAPVEFTVSNTVGTFIYNNIINKTEVKNKTNISTRAAFYEKYTEIEIESATVNNSTAALPALTLDEWNELIAFEYVTSGSNENNYYIKGSVSSEAPMGDYTVVTILKSSEYIPDLKVIWNFSVRVPQLKPSSLLVNGQYMITLPAPSPLITASYSGILNNAFQQQSGKFTYNYLNGTCPDFIAPYFIFKDVPEGYDISEDGTTVLKDGVEAAIIEDQDGVFTIRLIEGPAAHGLVGTNQLKVEAKGVINNGTYVIYPAFSVVFVPPLNFSLPTTAAFSNNQYIFNMYASGWSGADIIRTWDNLSIALVKNEEAAKLYISYYGINYSYDQEYNHGGTTLSSPLKLDLENITYASGSSNTFNNMLSDLGSTVTVGQFLYGDSKAYFNLTTPIRYRLAFNRNGATLPANLRISIPVTMEHRWGITEGNLVIRVN